MSRAPYRSQLREAAAEQTRRAVLDAARELFTERGYVETTVADIAARAGVAVPTVYASAGGKRELLVALCREAAAGDSVDEAGAQISAASSGEAVLQVITAGARAVNERYSAILEVASEARSVPEARASWERGLDNTQAVCAAAARRLAGLGALRPGVGESAAATALSALVHPYTFRTLVVQLDLSWEAAERWLLQSLVRLLLPG